MSAWSRIAAPVEGSARFSNGVVSSRLPDPDADADAAACTWSAMAYARREHRVRRSQAALSNFGKGHEQA